MEDFWVVGCVLMALTIFYVLYSLYQMFFCGDSCEEYTEYNDDLDNEADEVEKFYKEK